MSQPVKKSSARTSIVPASPPRRSIELPDDVVLRIVAKAGRYSSLHAMACTCKRWNQVTEPVFESLRRIAFDHYSATPKEEPDSIFESGLALGFALSHLRSRLVNHEIEELPEHIIMLSCSFVNFLASMDASDRIRHAAPFLPWLRGLTQSRWDRLMNLIPAAHDKVLMRLAAISSPQAKRIFPQQSVLDAQAAQSTLDLTLHLQTQELPALVSLSYDWANIHGAKHLPQALLSALPDDHRLLKPSGTSFRAETIVCVLKQPGSRFKQAELLEALLKPLMEKPYKGIDLPAGSEAEILSLINAWLSSQPILFEAPVLTYLAKRIAAGKFDLSMATHGLSELTARALHRKKAKCKDAALLIETLMKHGPVTKKDLKIAAKRRS